MQQHQRYNLFLILQIFFLVKTLRLHYPQGTRQLTVWSEWCVVLAEADIASWHEPQTDKRTELCSSIQSTSFKLHTSTLFLIHFQSCSLQP